MEEYKVNVGTNDPILMHFLLSFNWQKSFVFARRSCQKLKMAKIHLLNNLDDYMAVRCKTALEMK